MNPSLLVHSHSTKAAPPRVAARRVIVDPFAPWEHLERAFHDAEAVSLGQAWRDALDPAFAPAGVRVAHNKDSLLVFATLVDHDIHNPVEEFNAPAFMHGDAFEMFFRPAGQSSYIEIHVTPRNQLFQLRIPSAEVFQAQRSNPEAQSAWRVADRRIESRVRIEPEEKRWSALAAIPFDMAIEPGNVRGRTEWLFSFSRYDYTRGVKTPVLSSSSPHAALDFHRQQEWGTLTFV